MVFCYVAAQLHLKMTLLHVSVAYGVNEHRDVQGSKFMVFQLSALLAFFNAPPQFNHHMSFLFIFMLKAVPKSVISSLVYDKCNNKYEPFSWCGSIFYRQKLEEEERRRNARRNLRFHFVVWSINEP